MVKRSRTVLQRSNALREKRLLDIGYLMTRGCTRDEMAKKFKVSMQSVDADIRDVIQGWADRTCDEHGHKAVAVQRLERVLEVAWQDYERSKAETTLTVVRCDTCFGKGVISTGGCPACGGEGRYKEKKITHKSKGDPKYLSIMVMVVKEIAQLDGLYIQRKDLREDQVEQHVHGHLHLEQNPFKDVPQGELINAQRIMECLDKGAVDGRFVVEGENTRRPDVGEEGTIEGNENQGD